MSPQDSSSAAPRPDSPAAGDRVLLHVCCGPCATHCIEELRTRGYHVLLFFSNSNLAPESEYRQRLAAVERLAAVSACELVVDAYDHGAWREFVRGLEAEPERGARCLKCFEFNLARAAAAARRLGVPCFTTTLTVSPHKRSPDLFRVGAALGPFLAVDFKKRDGFRRSLERARQLGLYRQSYCGCEFSHSSGAASLGMRQSARGDSAMVPTLGPSGSAERLN